MNEREAAFKESEAVAEQVKVLKKESEESKARIKEALAAAEGFEHEAMTLSEQVTHLISDLKEGRRDLRETLERTAMLQDALETTATRLERVERASATERAALVQSALASLHHLRCHFAAQQGGRLDEAERLEAARDDVVDSILIPFQSPSWWRVYGAGHGAQRAGALASMAVHPRSKSDGASRTSSRTWTGRVLAESYHPASKKAAWHEQRPSEARAARAVAAMLEPQTVDATVKAAVNSSVQYMDMKGNVYTYPQARAQMSISTDVYPHPPVTDPVTVSSPRPVKVAVRRPATASAAGMERKAERARQLSKISPDVVPGASSPPTVGMVAVKTATSTQAATTPSTRPASSPVALRAGSPPLHKGVFSCAGASAQLQRGQAITARLPTGPSLSPRPYSALSPATGAGRNR